MLARPLPLRAATSYDTMEFAAISDVHGNILALRAVLADINRAGVDLIVNLGDILSGPLWPAETADFLMPLNLPTVRGNHERQLLTQKVDDMSATDRFTTSKISAKHTEWLSQLPESLHLNEDVFLCHGTPDSDLKYLLEDIESSRGIAASADTVMDRLGSTNSPLVLCGHTHIQRDLLLPTGQMVVNPGSVGLPAYEDDKPTYHKMQSGTPHARYAILSIGPDGRWSADLRQVEYDWEGAANQADEQGRPDWSSALRSGYCC